MTKEIRIKIPEKEDFSEGLVNLVKFFLDSETKSKIYLYLRKKGKATSREIAKGANLYPSSVREALVEMHKGGIVKRKKLKKEGAGKNPYVYEAIGTKMLTKRKIKKIEERLNKLFSLDAHLQEGKEIKAPRIPVRIRIEKIPEEDEEK